MIITKDHQEALVAKYVKEKHNTDECIGFIDGLITGLGLVKNINNDAVLGIEKITNIKKEL